MPCRSVLSMLVLVAACTTIRREPGMEAYYQACIDATTDAVVLNVAAHPDDEAARTLVYLRRKHGLRTFTLYSTCGGGGQNAVGPEIGEDLARLRTRETLAAARVTGTQVRWLGFEDFGYSKTAEETFETWGRGEYLEALDKSLDEIRPDVVFTNHAPDRGHGHHRVTSLATRELVARRPGLLLFERMPGDMWFEKPDQMSAQAEPDAVFPVGEVDPSTGESYARQAMRAWRMHRSQGMGAIGVWRLRADAWKQILPKEGDRGFDPSSLPSLFDSEEFLAFARQQQVDPQKLKVQLSRFKEGRPIPVQVDQAKSLIPTLRRLREGWKGADEVAARLERRIDALERVVLEGLGIHMVVTLDQERIPVSGTGTLTLRTASKVELEDVRLQPPGGGWVEASTSEKITTVTTGPLVSVDPSKVWPATLEPTVSFVVDGLPIRRDVEIYFTPVPAVKLTFQPGILLLPAPQETARRMVELEVEWNGDGELLSRLQFESPKGAPVKPDRAAIRLTPEHRRTTVQTLVTLDASGPRNLRVVARIEPDGNGGTKATARLDIRAVPMHRPRELRIGLIRGPDDTLHQVFEDLELDYQLLDPVTLKAVDLSRFTTIVIDIRAYGTRRDLVEQRERLLGFCKNGGRVVCFYHKPREWNPHENQPLLAPYDLEIGRRRVSQEDAPVKVLQPGHRIWNHPNKIKATDFDAWVQERGLNFPAKWGKEWVPLVAMGDKGEKPLSGGLLYARYGKGDYVYCALVLYRQLRQGHGGAARILVNLLSP